MTREWILVVVAPGVVVVVANPDTELGAALPMSATDPPARAPPVTTAVTSNDRPLIDFPISLSASPDRRRVGWMSWMLRIVLETDPTKGEPGGRIRHGQMVVFVVPLTKYGKDFLHFREWEMRVHSSFDYPRTLRVGRTSCGDSTSAGDTDRARGCAFEMGRAYELGCCGA